MYMLFSLANGIELNNLFFHFIGLDSFLAYDQIISEVSKVRLGDRT